jgi:hypothetical protein
MERVIMNDNNPPKIHNTGDWSAEHLHRACDTLLRNVEHHKLLDDHTQSGLEIEHLHRFADEFSRRAERQKQIDELTRGGLDRELALVVVDL